MCCRHGNRLHVWHLVGGLIGLPRLADCGMEFGPPLGLVLRFVQVANGAETVG